MTRRPFVRLLTALLPILAAACGSDTLDRLPPPAPAELTAGVRVTPTALSFGDVQVGCSKTLALRVDNTGDLEVELGQAEVSAPAFVLSGQLPPTLQASQHADLVVNYVPINVGPDSGQLRFSTSLSEAPLFEVNLSGTAVPPAPKPVDLMIVIDISTTMDDETNALHAAVDALLDVVEQSGLDARLFLTTFVNDVIVHGNGTALDRAAFFVELESQLEESSGQWFTNSSLPRNVDNTDMPENILDALHRTAAESDLRVGVRRQIVLMTDDTFLEPPEIYSGGNPALYSYDDVALELLLEGISLQAFHSTALPEGFAAPYSAQPSLVEMTNGNAYDIQSLVGGQINLADMLIGIVENSCDL